MAFKKKMNVKRRDKAYERADAKKPEISKKTDILRWIEFAAVIGAVVAFGVDTWFRFDERAHREDERNARTEERQARHEARAVTQVRMLTELGRALELSEDEKKALGGGCKSLNDVKSWHPRSVTVRSAVEVLVSQGVSLRGMDFSFVNLSGAMLRGANFFHTTIECANLTDVNLENVVMRSVNVRASDFSGANMSNGIFSVVDWSSARLFGASFIDADLMLSHLSGALIRVDKIDPDDYQGLVDELKILARGDTKFSNTAVSLYNLEKIPFTLRQRAGLCTKDDLKRVQLEVNVTLEVKECKTNVQRTSRLF